MRMKILYFYVGRGYRGGQPRLVPRLLVSFRHWRWIPRFRKAEQADWPVRESDNIFDVVGCNDYNKGPFEFRPSMVAYKFNLDWACFTLQWGRVMWVVPGPKLRARYALYVDMEVNGGKIEWDWEHGRRIGKG